MQRIQRDKSSAPTRERIDRREQVREIPATPIARRPQTVEADGDSGRSSLKGTRARRTDDEVRLGQRLQLGLPHAENAQFVIAEPQVGRQRDPLSSIDIPQFRQPEPVML